MRRFLMCAAAMAVVWGMAIGHAQMKVTNLEEHDKAMKALGGAFGGANKAVAAGSMADVKTALATLKSTLMAVEGFWAANKKTAQVDFAKAAIAKVDVADKAASGTDTAAVGAAVKDIITACGACHTATREPDPATPKSFIVKAGIL